MSLSRALSSVVRHPRRPSLKPLAWRDLPRTGSLPRPAGVLALTLLLTAACGGGPEDTHDTVATARAVRGSLGEGTPTSLRLAPGQELGVPQDGVAWVELDAGPRVLAAAGARLAVDAEGTLTVDGGRVYVEVAAEDALTVRFGTETEGMELHLSDAAVSLENTPARNVYVVRGDVTYAAPNGEHPGAVGTGERYTQAADAPVPATLWEDWTGGLAEPGGAREQGAGVGVLEARVPDEVGLARWPLVVRRLSVHVRIEGDLAVTEVEQEFFNPASEMVEGLYRISVPEQAVLQRFAVDRRGRLVDGYIKEKAQAARQYQQQVYRGSTLDPALLEWDAPGRYRARIYPIQPGATRRIAIRYVEWLRRPGADQPRVYRFPMGAGGDAPLVSEFEFSADLREALAGSVRAGHGARVEDGRVVLRRSDFRPRSDLFLELVDGEDTPRGRLAYRAEHQAPARDPSAGPIAQEPESDYWYLPLVLPRDLATADGANTTPPGLDLVLVADVSAATESTQLELGRGVIEALAAHLSADDRVAIVASDLGLRAVTDEPVALGPASRERVETLLDGLARVPSGGASDLGATLAAAAALLDPQRPGVVVYVGDGAPTVGELEADALLERVARLPRPLRAYAVAVGADAELGLLETLTRGSGLSRRVETRAEGARVALEVLGHARRPVAQRVEVELGAGIEQQFPRRPVDVVLGEPLSIVGRVDGTPPTSVTVRGELHGQPFERTFEVETQTISDSGDLRLRWAQERLHQLLLSGEGRQEIADLGTRYGLITPFTSFYVPSEQELSQLGPSARELMGDVQYAHAATTNPLLFPFALAGCSLDASPEGTSATYPEPSMEESESADSPSEPPGQWAGSHSQSGSPAPVVAAPSTVPVPAAPSPEPEAPADDAAGYGRMAREEAQPAEAAAMAGALGSLAGDEAPPPPGTYGITGTGRGGGGMGEGTLGMGNIGTIGHGSGGEARPMNAPRPMRSRAASQGPVQERDVRRSASGSERSRNQAADVLDALGDATQQRSARYDDRAEDSEALADTGVAMNHAGGRTTITTRVTIDTQPRHERSRCSDASRASLDDRVELWRERLGARSNAYAWLQVYQQAVAHCEARSWTERRRLLDLMLSRAGNVPAMISLYTASTSSSLRGYFRNAIVRRVRSAEDLRLVRRTFGSNVDQEMIDRAMAGAANDAAKVRVLRRLIAQFPTHMELQLQLLELLERTGQRAEARRLARTMRQSPLADAGVRTAIGEFYLRLEDEAEARRVFSEIVEFAPRDELARRRLGDLYRAHGWFDEAYRQYQTLAAIRPDDTSVNLLLAQAAAGAGRVDEALRLEQALAQTGQPGDAVGLARTALLWSSVRFAELRAAAHAANDADGLAALVARMRRSGVMGQASPLRASLVWSHPDANVGLWASYPGLGLTRPTDITPEYGIEAFDVREAEDGTYRLEVRRQGERHLTAVEAKLVVVWREGADDERVEVRSLRFEGDQRAYGFTIAGDTLSEATPTPSNSSTGRR
ncbi:MAG: hypothetical protein KC668_23040 [Myxococcales bacterium]|nr:hypothetical protein [Myxococcales bacterium]